MKFPFNINENHEKDWSIFTDKNKSFGAFQFSKHYRKYLLTGFLIAIFIILSAFGTPLVLRKLSGDQVKIDQDQSKNKKQKVVSYAKLSPPPDIEKDQPEPEEKPEEEPEPEEPEPEEIPKKEPEKKPKPEKTKELTTPEVKKDEKVKEKTEGLASQSEAEAAAKADTGAESKSPESEEKEQKVLDFAEQKPTFPGGRNELLTYIQENINYPEPARKEGAQGQVVVQFVVQPDGSLTDIKVLKDVGYGTAKEAKRLIKSMPKWNAGVQNGRKVPVRMTLPIDFNLDAPSDDL